jgi:DNA primase
LQYDEDFLQEISSNVDLVDYIGQDIELKQKGKDYFGHCTKHLDRTASFSVNPSKNMYYCFSCGRGGSIIQYLQEYEGLSFDDAVEKTCRLANADISQMCYSPTVKLLKKIRKLRQKYVSTEHTILDETEYEKYKKLPINEWLDEGIRQKEIDMFDIRIDEKSNRIVYPVRDLQGRLINIKGRTRFEDYKAMHLMKYINYFPVGTMDYFQGLDVTLPYVKENNEIILFESIKSVMKCFGWGYKNCASVEKHSVTDEQIRLLIRLKVNIVFAYDSDVSYRTKDIIESLTKLKRFTNVFIIEDKDMLLGGVEAKNSPADLGMQTFEKLYKKKRRVR